MTNTPNIRSLVYVAGPYAASTPTGVQQNVQRACAIGRLATVRGYAPVVPHALGYMSCHGDPLEADDGTTREAALACGVSLAAAVASCGGTLWVLQRDDGSMSGGTQWEHDTFEDVLRNLGQVQDPTRILVASWAGWRVMFEMHGLGALWNVR